MRLFFALCPDEEAATLLECDAAKLSVDDGAQLVARENYHVTVAFLGEISADRLPMLLSATQQLRAAPCEIVLDHHEFWPPASVLVAAASYNSPALIDLAARLDAAIAVAGLTCDRSTPLHAHATLARKVTQAPVSTAMTPITWTAHSLSLMRSRSSDRRPVYTVVATWPLLYGMPRI